MHAQGKTLAQAIATAPEKATPFNFQRVIVGAACHSGINGHEGLCLACKMCIYSLVCARAEGIIRVREPSSRSGSNITRISLLAPLPPILGHARTQILMAVSYISCVTYMKVISERVRNTRHHLYGVKWVVSISRERQGV